MRTIKWLCSAVSFLLFTVRFVSAGDLAIAPSDKVIVYNAAQMPEVAWMLAHLDSAGFQVPKDGDSFAFKDFLDPVPDNIPKVNDLCFYTGNGKEMGFGIVSEIGDNLNVVLISPAGHGLMIIQSIDLTQVRGFMRPSKPIKEHGKGEHI